MLSDVAVARRRLRLGKELLGGESTDNSACPIGCRPHRWSLAQAAFLIASMVGFEREVASGAGLWRASFQAAFLWAPLAHVAR